MRNLFVVSITIFVLLQLVFSCNRDNIYDQYVQVKDGKWDKDYAARFDVPIEDTLTFYKVFLNIRNDSHYPYRNIYLFMDVTNPSGKVERDTIEINLADQYGKWLGSGFGDIKYNKILLSPSVHFAQKGTYTMLVEQAMRNDTLVGIRDIGISVEKNK